MSRSGSLSRCRCRLQPGRSSASPAPRAAARPGCCARSPTWNRTAAIVCSDIRQSETPAHRWRARVMMIPAESQWWHETVGEHFDAGDAPGEALEALDLPGEATSWLIDRLSSGEKQRLALIRALAREPRALLLDEPTANLDAESIQRVERWLLEIIERRELPTLWVAHDAEQIKRVSNRHLLIRDGRLQES